MAHDHPHPQRLRSAQDLLGAGLATIGGDLGRIVGAWPRIVGARLARVSTPSSLKGGTLRVRCASASWAQSLAGSELQLLDRLADELGPGVVTRIHARAGGPAPRLEEEPAPPAPLPPLDPARLAQLEQLVAHIEDPALRARLLAAATATERRRSMRPNP